MGVRKTHSVKGMEPASAVDRESKAFAVSRSMLRLAATASPTVDDQVPVALVTVPVKSSWIGAAWARAPSSVSTPLAIRARTTVTTIFRTAHPLIRSENACQIPEG